MKNFFKTLSVTSIIFSGSVFGLNSSLLHDSGTYKNSSRVDSISYTPNRPDFPPEPCSIRDALPYIAEDMQYQAAQNRLQNAKQDLIYMWNESFAEQIINCVLNTVFIDRSLFNQDDPSKTLDYRDDPNFSLLFPPKSSSPKLEDIKTKEAAKWIEKEIKILSDHIKRLVKEEESSAFSKYKTASKAVLDSLEEQIKTPEEKAADEIRKKFNSQQAEIYEKYKQDADALKDKFNLDLLSEKHEECDRARKEAEDELYEALRELEAARTNNATEEEKKNVKEKYNNAKQKRDKCDAELLLAEKKLTEQEKTYKAKLDEIKNAYFNKQEEIDEQLQQELDELKKNQK